LIITQYQNKAA